MDGGASKLASTFRRGYTPLELTFEDYRPAHDMSFSESLAVIYQPLSYQFGLFGIRSYGLPILTSTFVNIVTRCSILLCGYLL